MATPNEVHGVQTAVAYILARILICLLGLGAVAWGGLALPLFWQQAPTDRIAAAVLRGDNFKMQLLRDATRQAERAKQSSFCDPAASHNAVVLYLAILDKTIATNQPLVDSDYGRLYDATRSALACAPSGSFAWLTLFWLDARKHGFGPDNAKYLRLSYAFGPNEGWIALRRSRLAFALFAQLPPDLSDRAIDEFVKLVDTGRLSSETAAIFANAPSVGQNRIVEHLKDANPISRQMFARMLYDGGLDVHIPDAEIPGLPRWER